MTAARRSRRRHRAPAHRVQPSGPAPPRRWRRGTAIAVAIAAVVTAAWLGWRTRPAAPPPAARRVTVDPAASLAPAEARRRAQQLHDQGRSLESLPYFRRALAPPSPVQAHVECASALTDAALEVRSVHGQVFPATRSAFERVALLREALGELDVAERWVSNPAGRAAIVNRRGNMMKVWGFPWLCESELARAAELDPRSPTYGEEAALYLRLLRHPDQGPSGEEP